MLRDLKLLILVNWKEDGKWFLPHFLRGAVRQVDLLQPFSFKRLTSSKLTYISNYLSEFYVPLRAVFRHKKQDIVISWQMRIGITYGILKRIVHRGKPPVHIIQDFHIDLTKHSRLYLLQIALMKRAIPGIDFFFCTSTEEEAIYSRIFSIPRNRILFLPLAESPNTFQEKGYPKRDYVFSYGKSDRDFETLIKAATLLKMPIYILSQRYQPTMPLPDNVSMIRSYISGEEMIRWIASSRAVVVPLKDYRIAAGQISMLEVMALGRPLVVTENMATKEYAVHRQTACFFQAGNERELAEQIQYLWDNTEEAERIGERSRTAAMKLNDSRLAILNAVLEQCAKDLPKGEK